jgi:superkiller protein 3
MISVGMKRFLVISLAALGGVCAIAPQTALGAYWHPDDHLNNSEAPMAVLPARETKERLDERLREYERTPHNVVPTNAEGWFELGVAYSTAGKPKEAVNPLRTAVNLDPRYFEAWNRLGISLIETGGGDEAIDAFQHVIDIRPGMLEGWINIATACIRKGRLSQAERYFHRALALNSSSKESWNGIANLRLAQGQGDAALQALDNSLKIDPGYSFALVNRALVLYSRHEIWSAIDCMRHAVRAAPRMMHARVALELWLADANHLQEAAWIAKGTLVENPSERNSMEILAAYDLKSYRLQEGIDESVKARALGYDGVESLSNLTKVLTDLRRFDEAEKLVTQAIAVNPKDENPVVFLGVVRLKQKRLADGIALFKKALEMNPKNSRALLSLSDGYRQQGRADESIQCAKQALDQDPRNSEAWLSIGASEEQRGNWSGAGDAYRKATEVDPGNYRCWQSVANVSPDYEKACEAARKALALAPDERSAQALLPVIQQKFKKTDEAIASYELALKDSPENITAANGLFRMVISLGKLQDGEEFFREMTRAHSSSALSWMMLGEVCDAERKYADAREALQKSVKLAPGNAISWIGLATITMENAGHHKSTTPGAPVDPVVRSAGAEAEASIRKALAIEPENPAAFERLSLALIYQNRYDEAEAAARKAISLDGSMANARFELANCFYCSGNVRGAIESFEASVRLAPGDFDHWAGLLACYRELKDLPAGEEELRKLAAELPEASPGWFFLGTLLAEHGKNQDAVELYSKAISLTKVFPVAWNSMGVAHRDLGDVGKAVDCYRKAIEEMPGYAEAWNNMGRAYFTMDKAPEAIDAYQHALKAEPANANALVNLAEAAAKIGDTDLAKKTCDQLAKINSPLADETRLRVLK